MNRLSLTCGLAAMDLCWVYPWSVLVGLWTGMPVGDSLVSPLSVLALLLVGAFAAQALGRYALKSRAARLLSAGFGLVAAAAVVRLDQYAGLGALDWIAALVGALVVTFGQFSAPVLAFAVALYLWWRGLRLGRQAPSYLDTESAFRWGIGRLVTFGLVLAITTRPSALSVLEAKTTPYVVGFFFVSLLTLALGRLESLRTRTRALKVNTQWLGVLVIVAACVVLLGLVAGQIVSFDLLLTATRPLFDALGQVVLLLAYALVIPLAYLVQWLIYLILSVLHGIPSQPPPQALQPSDINNLLERFFNELVPPGLLLVLKAVAAATLLGVALLILARALTRWRPAGAEADVTNEERDSVFDARRMRELLLGWLKRLFRRTRRGEATADALTEPAPVANASVSLSSIRELYARLLRLGEDTGIHRAPATTPLEHSPALRRSLEPDAGVADLTAAYLRARYAESESTAAEIAALRQELEALHPKGAGQAELPHTAGAG